MLSTVSITQQWQQLDDIYQCRVLEVERKFRDGGIIAKSKVIILASGGREKNGWVLFCEVSWARRKSRQVEEWLGSDQESQRHIETHVMVTGTHVTKFYSFAHFHQTSLLLSITHALIEYVIHPHFRVLG